MGPAPFNFSTGASSGSGGGVQLRAGGGDVCVSSGVIQELTISAPSLPPVAETAAALPTCRPARRHSLGVMPSAKPKAASAPAPNTMSAKASPARPRAECAAPTTPPPISSPAAPPMPAGTGQAMLSRATAAPMASAAAASGIDAAPSTTRQRSRPMPPRVPSR